MDTKKILDAKEVIQLMKIANVIGREINEEVNESINNAIDGTICKIMVAEMILMNLQHGFCELNPAGGEASFKELHGKVREMISSYSYIKPGGSDGRNKN